MIPNTEQLRQKAHALALTHDSYMSAWPSRKLWREFCGAVEELRALAGALRDGGADCAEPAAEWLLDNAEFIEEQALVVRQQLTGRFLRRLPDLRKSGEKRILSICDDYLELTDGDFDIESFINYVNCYQNVAILTVAETWAIPLVMRIALIRRLAVVMAPVRERYEVCLMVERLLARLEKEQPEPQVLKAALEKAGQDMPLSGPVIVELSRRLREWAGDAATVREWLMCKLENGADSLDRIVSYEYQLQAVHQMAVGNIIGSLRRLLRLDWQEPFERLCLVERTLREEAAGVYPRLNFASRDILRRRVEGLAHRLGVPENLVAQHAVRLAADASGSADDGGADGAPPPRRAFVAYYLLEADGIRELRRALHVCGPLPHMPEIRILRHAGCVYFATLTSIFMVCLLGFAGWATGGKTLTALQWALALLLLSLPASEWAVAAVHTLITFMRQPYLPLCLDLSRGVPTEAATMVVMPVIWSSAEDVRECVERLELHYLANRDANIHFALLGDFADATTERLPDDDAIMNVARASIEALNDLYSRQGGSTFHVLLRRRVWNSHEGVWMGWERKRGKLVEFVELLKGRRDTTFAMVVGDVAVLPRIRYVITLDADTEMPLESARRMIGVMHLPYNRPRLNRSRTRVVEGYGILQPRVAMSHDAAARSRLASLWAAYPGVDPYVFAAADPYQDWWGQGIFTGKGIFDVEAFAAILCERIPENKVLSHDLLEGGFMRAGLLSDIEFIDGHPATFSACQMRTHRWVRGDWQLLPWLARRVPDRQGKSQPVDLPPLTRWQIIDNLRRSLLLPVLYASLLAGLTILPGVPERWLAVMLATMWLPWLRQLAACRWVVRRPRSLLCVAGQVLVNIMTLPFQSAVLLDAIGRTLYRLYISKRHLLQWVSAAEVERRQRGGRCPALLGLYGGYVLVLLMALVAAAATPPLRWMVLGLCAFWAVAPLAVRWLDRPAERPERPLSACERDELRRLAQQIWTFFEDYVTETEHWLPPDNVQWEPPNGIAHRTSPTNIGLYLTCALAARDLGFIDTPGLVERLERTVATVERLPQWYGHLYNWYDTVTLAVLPPQYVSTVDSGNFVACLMTARQGLSEWLAANTAGNGPDSPAASHTGTAASADAAFAQELAPVLPADGCEDWRRRGQELLARLAALIDRTDFRPLYNHAAKLFHLGYNGSLDRLDPILYDLLASEARLSSFVAIALGHVPAAHWRVLGRTMTRIGREVVLLSWSGSMFEYLMPGLFMRTYRRTVWENTYRASVRRQIAYARQRGVPFGISESGYYAFDYQMNYQYRAFGVPGLGFRHGLEQDLVVAPYATILALAWARRRGMTDLQWLERLGARGKYGYYEAVDFTAERLPRGRTHAVIRSFMAHHQGMSLLALGNMLTPHNALARFHQDKRVQAASLLLQERLPARPRIIRHPALLRSYALGGGRATAGVAREFPGADTPVPEVCVLSNGEFTTVVTNSGSGFCCWRGLAITRWREDPVLDNWGYYIYIRDVAGDAVWSPSFQPCRAAAATERVRFSPERAVFTRTDGETQTSLEICVAPEWNAEVRRLTLTNTGAEARIFEVTTFLELSLASPDTDAAHPAFNKLFIETAYAEASGYLLARRRGRLAGDPPLWAAHTLFAASQDVGPAEYDTDRAAFIGRGRTLGLPQGICSRLHRTVGAVADPAFVMRRRVRIGPGEQVQLFAVTAVGDSEEQVVDIINRFRGELAVERTFQLAWNRCQIEMRHLHLTPAQAAIWQTFAGRVLYTPPLRPERRRGIAANVRGQSGLWPYGISGNAPIVLAKIREQTDMRFATGLLTGREYLRRLGLSFDLVFLNESMGSYRDGLQESLRRAAEQSDDWGGGVGTGGIFVINDGTLPDEDRTLLYATARVVLRADGPSLGAQIRLPRDAAAWPVPCSSPVGTGSLSSSSVSAAAAGQDMLFFNGWGGFTPDGREYRITVSSGNHPPAPWINVIANPRFGCLISELGSGYAWWRNSRECKLTPWTNDPVLDPMGEACYIRDDEDGSLWTAAPERGADPSVPPCIVSHGWGYTRFQQERQGIGLETTVFVPCADPVKIILLRLRNRSDHPRRLSVTYYAEWVLGVQRQTNAPFIITEWDESARLLLARNAYQEVFRNACAFLGVYVQRREKDSGSLDAAPDGLSWTGDRRAFLGPCGTWEKPAALRGDGLPGQTGTIHDACGAVQAKVALDAGGERTVCILLGADESRAAATALAGKYSRSASCRRALEEVRAFWDDVLGQITVATPWQEMDVLLNGWLLYQTLSCRMWARSAFYQAGGAYGFRDQLQDSLALLHSRPDFTRAQILRHAAHQYEEGDVQHWWHEETGCGIRTRISDDLLWLPYAVARYIEHTGDDGILAETAPFLHSEPLAEDEHERYEAAQTAARHGTVFEHCLRAIDRAVERRGEHGLPLIGGGDWNDGLSRIGLAGRGESVWLGWFLCDVLHRFAALCRRHGDNARAERYRCAREQLAASLDKHAWDGQWYRRAFTDAGQWLGSVTGNECRIDAIAQSWAVISGAAAAEKARQALQAFDRELVDRTLAVAQLLTPPFDHTEPSPGYIQGYPPGIRENGAQYTHGVIWSIIAWCRLGEGDKAGELFQMLNPLNHARTSGEARRYAGEPYVMAADVYTAAPHTGHAGWTWYTGAAGWMYQAGIEWILGLRRRGDVLYINPCIPNAWPEFSVRYRYGRACYHITVRNPAHKSRGVTTMHLDGRETGPASWKEADGPSFTLRDDGREHQVTLVL